MKIHFLPLSLLLVFLSSVPACAGAPLDAVQANVNKVLEVLRDPALKAPAAKEQKKNKLSSIYENMFDEEELSKRALSRNWNKLNPAQQKEFIHLFRQVLEKAYIDKILSYTNEKIVFYRPQSVLTVLNLDSLIRFFCLLPDYPELMHACP